MNGSRKGWRALAIIHRADDHTRASVIMVRASSRDSALREVRHQSYMRLAHRVNVIIARPRQSMTSRHAERVTYAYNASTRKCIEV